MNYKEAMAFLEDSNRFGSVLGLDTMRTLLKELGNPQDKLKFVHIAGTNGKGSTASFITAMLAAAGYRVGRYISPAVFEYREKIQITALHSGKKLEHLEKSSLDTVSGKANNAENYNTTENIISEYIKEPEITEFIERIKKACNNMTEKGLPHPTVFEIETAMAMLHFLKENCDIVVLEVGLGGRLDATNVITTTECAVITSISMDHMQILGNTLEQIAGEKAGIIKPEIQVVSYEQQPEAMGVIETVCKENQAILTEADFKHITIEKQDLEGTAFSYNDLSNLHICLLGKNQVKNAVTAIHAIKALNRVGYNISEEEIRIGLYAAKWSGRFEIISRNPYIIIDGAHNEDAARSLAENLQLYFSNQRLIFIMGVLADKDYDSILRSTASFAEQIITITPNNTRGLGSDRLAEAASAYCDNVTDAKTVSVALSIAKEAAGKDGIILSFGSLSYLNEVYRQVLC